MIYFFTPYSWQHDLGKAYNDYVKLVPSKEDWICFVDADLMFLQPDFGHHLQEIIDLYPNAGLLTCLTNRVGTLEQCYNNTISEDPNILNHRKIALQLAREQRHKVKEIKNPFSGHLMLFKKETWDSIGGAPEGRGILSVDNTITNRMARHNYSLLVMEGIYCLHYYRLCEGRFNKDHLK
jgi:GT2 family glycosyltransferase